MKAERSRARAGARQAILFILAFAPIFTLATFRARPLLALGVLFLSHVLALIPTLVANCQWWGLVVTSFETPQREVWLTIDDGPDPIHTPRMIELLGRYEAKATFFAIGHRVLNYRREAEAILAAGHQIANHTFSHPSASFWCLDRGRIAAQIDQFPLPTPYLRTPAGLKNFFVHPELARRDMLLIGWTVRGLDTVSHDPAKVAARILRRVRPGAIILLHEGHRLARDPEFHVRCLELTLRGLTNAGYRCVVPAAEQLRSLVGGGGKQRGGC